MSVQDVAVSKRDGIWTGGVARLGTYATAQRLQAANRKAILVLDEADDVFPSLGERRAESADKAWVHQLLERNAVPAIWIQTS